MVTIYRFKVWDGTEMKVSGRWATRKAVESPGPNPTKNSSIGAIIEGTGIEVNSSVLDGNDMTPIGFVPGARSRM